MEIPKDSLLSFEYVGTRLLLAGWLRSFEFVTSLGYVFKWSELGEQRVHLIQQIIADFELTDDKGDAKRFTSACRCPEILPLMNYSAACRDFWLSCLAETGLDSQENHLFAFARIIQAGIEKERNPAKANDASPFSGLVILPVQDTVMSYG
jgi:hypothetical protein